MEHCKLNISPGKKKKRKRVPFAIDAADVPQRCGMADEKPQCGTLQIILEPSYFDKEISRNSVKLFPNAAESAQV